MNTDRNRLDVGSARSHWWDDFNHQNYDASVTLGMQLTSLFIKILVNINVLYIVIDNRCGIKVHKKWLRTGRRSGERSLYRWTDEEVVGWMRLMTNRSGILWGWPISRSGIWALIFFLANDDDNYVSELIFHNLKQMWKIKLLWFAISNFFMTLVSFSKRPTAVLSLGTLLKHVHQ